MYLHCSSCLLLSLLMLMMFDDMYMKFQAILCVYSPFSTNYVSSITDTLSSPNISVLCLLSIPCRAICICFGSSCHNQHLSGFRQAPLWPSDSSGASHLGPRPVSTYTYRQYAAAWDRAYTDADTYCRVAIC